MPKKCKTCRSSGSVITFTHTVRASGELTNGKTTVCVPAFCVVLAVLPLSSVCHLPLRLMLMIHLPDA
jgi:hypothetical protein